MLTYTLFIHLEKLLHGLARVGARAIMDQKEMRLRL
jgi:hypothetical protein